MIQSVRFFNFYTATIHRKKTLELRFIKCYLSISTWLISIENTRDTISQRAIYLFLNGANPYNSIINIFKNHPCLKIVVIFVYAIQVFMTMFAFGVAACHIDGYHSYRRDRLARRMGGVAIFVNDRYP